MMNDHADARQALRPHAAAAAAAAAAAVVEEDWDIAERLCQPRANKGREFFTFPCSPLQLANQKKRFLCFLRILLKLLGERDPHACMVVKDILRGYAKDRRLREIPPRSHIQELPHLLEIYRKIKTSLDEPLWQEAHSFLQLLIAARRAQRSSALFRREAYMGPPSHEISMDGS